MDREIIGDSYVSDAAEELNGREVLLTEKRPAASYNESDIREDCDEGPNFTRPGQKFPHHGPFQGKTRTFQDHTSQNLKR